LLPRHFTSIRMRKKKKISVRGLNRRKRLLVRGKRWK
jgi:hypothetical protein